MNLPPMRKGEASSPLRLASVAASTSEPTTATSDTLYVLHTTPLPSRFTYRWEYSKARRTLDRRAFTFPSWRGYTLPCVVMEELRL
jgi:hypothetical protein